MPEPPVAAFIATVLRIVLLLQSVPVLVGPRLVVPVTGEASLYSPTNARLFCCEKLFPFHREQIPMHSERLRCGGNARRAQARLGLAAGVAASSCAAASTRSERTISSQEPSAPAR